MKSRGLAETIIRLGALLAFCLGLETAIPMTTQYVRMLLGPEQFPADHLWLELALVAEPLGILLALALLFGLSRPIAMLLAGPEPPVAQGPGCAILGVALLVRGAAGLGGALVTGHVGPAFAPTLVGCWFFLQGSAEVMRLLIPNLRTQAGLLVVARGDRSQFTAAVIQLAAGLVVTVRAGRLSAWCTRVQKTAAKEPAP